MTVRPVYDLTRPYDARAFLSEERPNTRFVPSGNAARDAGKVTNVHQLTNPYRSHDSPRPSGDEALAALTLLAELRDWLAGVEPDLITAARDAGVTWRLWPRCCASVTAAPPSAATPALDRQVAGQNVPLDVPDVPQDVPATVAGPAGREWDDSDLCLWREDTVVEELTGSTVTGWDPDESSRPINGTSSCYPVHQVDRLAVVLPEPRQTRGGGAARDGRCVHSVCHGLLLSYPHRAGSERRTDPGPQTIRAVAFPTEFPLGAEDQHLGQMASRRTRQVKVVLAWPPPTAVTVTL